MSITVQTLAIKENKSLTVEQYISVNQDSASFPCYCNLSAAKIIISANIALLDTAESANQSLTFSHENQLELVVFSNISYLLLIEIVEQCQLSLTALNAINHRNNLVSFRFNVTSKDLKKSREILAQLSLKNSIEAALLENAPQLTIPGLLVMDMDSTTIEIECIDEIAMLAGVGEQVAAVTELAMQGKLDFAQSLHQRVSTLKDAPEKILEDVAKNIPLMPGLETLIQQLKLYNWRIAIASGGFTYFAEHLERMLGLDASFANKLEIENGKLTGKVLGNVVDAQAKANSLAVLTEKYNIDKNQTVAMGDGANDLVMMAAAYLGVAYHAKPIVLAQADSCINYSGLDCLLHWLK
ncbi:MAG: phosphoserine phosphatase SerB [Colwellia sp.]|nr:phosphoserine phosphatase SerB [Colwellia sp.]